VKIIRGFFDVVLGVAGQRFALLELKAALCGILRRFVLEPVDGMFDVNFRPDLVLRPRQEIRVRLAPRVL
jgi:cytochrome P450 family 4